MDQIIVVMASTATLAVALFGIAFILTQKVYSRVNRSFAVFLVVVAVNTFPDAFALILEKFPTVYIQALELVMWMPSSLFLAPLFWIYVYTLTSPVQRGPDHLLMHLLLPVLAIFLGLIMLLFPQETWAPLFSNAPLPSLVWPKAIVTITALLQFLLYPQIAIYLLLIVRRLIHFRLMLRDVYSSTEKHELRWIYVIGGLGLLFWLARALVLVISFDFEQKDMVFMFVNVTSIAGLVLIATLTLWGLRQRPPLEPNTEVAQTRGGVNDQASELPSEKYEKSALSAAASTRISRKLHAAMERDKMHRDPNLTLWSLARYIGASPNHVSQTLNEVIGKSFFDFVNGYRVSEAIGLLSMTNNTILNITYDVGFNARSTFYKSFKRITGQTPTNYRKSMSPSVGQGRLVSNSTIFDADGVTTPEKPFGL